MFYLRWTKLLSPALVLSSLLSLGGGALAWTQVDNGLRVDLPAGGQLTIANSRGNIRVEVWNEQHVSVAATIKGDRLSRSPVSILRTDELLAISVSGRDVGMSTRVDLVVLVPERSRAKVMSENGSVAIRGLPAELIVENKYGDIRAEFPASGDADIEAESANKSIVSTIAPTGAGAGDRMLKLRLGTGGRSVRLHTERGGIALASYGEPRAVAVSEEAPRKPVLIGGDRSSMGAGTPARPMTGPEEVDEGDVVRVDTELVTLNVSVIDRSTNRGLKGLTERDFKLFENGAPQELAHFESANAPFNLILLIDVSFSTQDKIGLIRDAALHFVQAARPADRIGVITFASHPIVVSPLTDDREALKRAVTEGIQPRGSTKVYDSLAFAIDEVLKKSNDSRRNAIILMSDGLDSTLPNVTGEGSVMSFNEVVSKIREFDGVLYSLWVNTETEYSSLSQLEVQPETFDLAHDQMEEYAEAGGGVFYEVDRLEDLAGAYERVVADLGTLYSLSYRPTNKVRDGKWRAIRVGVSRPDAVARGKRGYYAN